MNEMNGPLPRQVTRYECPIRACSWHCDDSGGFTALAMWVDPVAVTAMHLRAVESVIREHLETHSLLEWVTEVMRLRQLAPQDG